MQGWGVNKRVAYGAIEWCLTMLPPGWREQRLGLTLLINSLKHRMQSVLSRRRRR